MNPEQLLDFVMNRKWVALAALVIMFIIRMLKSDTKIPIDIPPRLRLPIASALGAFAGVLDKAIEAGDTTWTSALLKGGFAAAGAALLHCFLIDSLRGGKELNVPGLIKENTPPGPGKPPSIPPTAANEKTMADAVDVMREIEGLDKIKRRMMFACAGALALFISACSLFTPANVKSILSLKDFACIAQNAFLDEDALDTICEMLSAEQKAAAHAAARSTRYAADSRMRAVAPMCTDAGADATSTRVDVEAGAR